MGLQESLTTGDTVRQVDRTPMDVEPGTLMHKAIPPRMVEPYLTGLAVHYRRVRAPGR